MRVLVFGASITQGFYDTKGGWVSRLQRHYDRLQLADWSENQPTVFNLGISGDGTAELLKRMENEIIARKWPGEDFAFVISIGINDSFIKANGEFNLTEEQYRHNLTKLVEIAQKYSDKIMLLGLQSCDEKRTTPVSWSHISYTNDRIGLFDREMKQVAQDYEVEHLPIFEEIKKRFDEGSDIFEDGLHPNDAGHQLIFELVQPALDQLLNHK